MQKNTIKLFALLLSVLVWSCKDTQVEEEIFTAKERYASSLEYRVTVNSFGMLVFPSREAYDEYYEFLTRAIEDPENQYSKEYLKDCTKEYKALDEFEKLHGFYSLRTKYLNIECQELERGVEKLENLTFNPIPDDVQATLLNEHGEIMIGEEIYIVKTMSLSMSTHKENIESVLTLRDDEKGEKINYGKFDFHGSSKPTQTGLKKGGARSNCVASFEVDATPGSLVVSTQWTGSTEPGRMVTYNWGDGQTNTVPASVASMQHVYTSVQDYTITATVVDNSPVSACTDNTTRVAKLSQACIVIFSTNQGINGNYTFIPSPITNSSATPVSWEWTFGDGTTKTVTTPTGVVTHTYSCERNYNVTVKVTLSNSTTCSSFAFPIKVEGIDCVDDNYMTSWGDKYFNNGWNKIAYRTWIGGGLFPNKTWVKAKMKNFYRNHNGHWKKNKKHLGFDFGGQVFIEGGNGCNAGTPQALGGWQQSVHPRAIWQVHKKVFNPVHVDRARPYEVEYYVDLADGQNSQLIHVKISDDADCR